jgi:ABC transporter-related protein
MVAKTNTVPVIQLKGLTKRYGIGDTARDVLDSVSLKIEQGEFIAVMGPSGCGKTTLLNVIGLLDRPDGGEYSLNGASAARLSGAQRARARATQIGIVFQSFNLINRLTVLENVALPLTYQGVSRVKRLERASEILKTFHLQEREYYMPWQLSGGQMQRVAIARALVSKPSIILADEPTGNLDSRSSHVIMEELAQLHKQGNTIIMVTHNPNLTSYASRVINMLDGKIASDTKIRIASDNESEKSVKISLNARRTAKEERDNVRSAKKKSAKETKNDSNLAADERESSGSDDVEPSSSQSSDQTERKKAES